MRRGSLAFQLAQALGCFHRYRLTQHFEVSRRRAPAISLALHPAFEIRFRPVRGLVDSLKIGIIVCRIPIEYSGPPVENDEPAHERPMDRRVGDLHPIGIGGQKAGTVGNIDFLRIVIDRHRKRGHRSAGQAFADELADRTCLRQRRAEEQRRRHGPTNGMSNFQAKPLTIENPIDGQANVGRGSAKETRELVLSQVCKHNIG